MARKKIAFVDDDPGLARAWIKDLKKILRGVSFTHYKSCEKLLKAMAGGKRYALYLVNTDLGRGMEGPCCTVAILSLHPEALIIGMSRVRGSSRVLARTYRDLGAVEFLNKEEGSAAMAALIRQFGF